MNRRIDQLTLTKAIRQEKNLIMKRFSTSLEVYGDLLFMLASDRPQINLHPNPEREVSENLSVEDQQYIDPMSKIGGDMLKTMA